MESLLRPASVAVIGASEDIRTYSGAPIHNLLSHGYRGHIYAVNPNRSEVQGLRSYASVLDIAGGVETAIVVVPSSAVLAVLEECAAKGVRSASVITSGFGEDSAGEAGRERSRQLVELMRRTGLRVLGPNTVGLANLVDSYVPRAAHNQLDPDRVKAGPVALITQSGACGNIVFNRAQVHGVGIGLSVATGDQVDIDIWELVDHVVEDDRYRAVLVVAETLGDRARLEAVALKADRAGKVVAVLKLGRSEAGRRAVMTHSGSLAGDALVQSAALRQLGFVEVEHLDALWQLGGLVAAWGAPGPEPRRLGVVALSGGEGALIADRCGEHGIELPPPAAVFERFIADNFAYAAAANPFDPSGEIIGRPEKVKLALGAFFAMNRYDQVLIASPVLRGEQAERQLGDLGEALSQPHPPVCLSYWPAAQLTQVQHDILAKTGEPVLPTSVAAVDAIALYRRAGLRRRAPALVPAAGPGRGRLAPDARYFEVRQELAGLGLPFPAAELVHGAEAAVSAAGRIGYPCVLKANVISSVHKLANRLIATEVPDADRARQAFAAIAAAGAAFNAEGVVVEAMAAGRLEVMIGCHRDPEFGGVLVFGGGGSLVEYHRDTAVAIAAYTDRAAADSLVGLTRVGRYLAAEAPDLRLRLAEWLLAVSGWFAANAQVGSLDLNPVLVDIGSGGLVCVDARVA